MVNNSITRELIDSGQMKRGYGVLINAKNQMITFRCTIVKVIKDGNERILKLKTGKDYPLGHKYIYRSLEELL